MHRRIVSGVSFVLAGLLAVMALVMTDLHDRDYPVRLHANAVANLDFAKSGLSDGAAFAQLGALSNRLGLGLVKVAPQLGADHNGQVFVPLGNPGRLPSMFDRFGDQADGQVRDATGLVNSYATGQYLVTGDDRGLGEMRDLLISKNVDVRLVHDDSRSVLQLVLRQGSFTSSLLATIALVAVLVLYWLSIKARGRALRMLAGVPGWRIQVADLFSFLVTVVQGVAACAVVAVIAVGSTAGWVYVPWYARSLILLVALVLIAAATFGAVMSIASRPTVHLLAARQPAITRLRTTSVVLKALIFVLVVSAVAPTVTAYRQAQDSAAQQARWTSLSNQVSLSFAGGLGESGFQKTLPRVGDLVAESEKLGSVALSYTWTNELPDGSPIKDGEALALVSRTWLKLMTNGTDSARREMGATAGLVPLTAAQLPPKIVDSLEPNLAIWSRNGLSGPQMLEKMKFFRSASNPPIPLSQAGGGELVFPKRAILVVPPDLSGTFNADFLASLSSSRNIVFAGAGPTEALVARHGLEREVGVKNVAEEGILRAQLTGYFAWLQGISLVALLVALAVAGSVAAVVTATTKARRDFPLRLAGKPWRRVLGQRVATECAVGAGLLILVVIARGGDDVTAVVAVGLVGLVSSPLAQWVAASRVFRRVSLRQM